MGDPRTAVVIGRQREAAGAGQPTPGEAGGAKRSRALRIPLKALTVLDETSWWGVFK